MKYIASLILALAFSTPLLSAETAPAAAKKKAAAEAAPATAKKKAPAKAEDKAETISPEATAAAKTLTPSQKTKLLTLLNTGDDAALNSLPGVGDSRVTGIKKARPFAEVTDLLKVNGIGDKIFEEIVAHAKAGFPQPEKKDKPSVEKPAKKDAAKKKGA